MQYAVDSTVTIQYAVQYTVLYTVQFTVHYTAQYTVQFTAHRMLYIVHSTHSTLNTKYTV